MAVILLAVAGGLVVETIAKTKRTAVNHNDPKKGATKAITKALLRPNRNRAIRSLILRGKKLPQCHLSQPKTETLES